MEKLFDTQIEVQTFSPGLRWISSEFIKCSDVSWNLAYQVGMYGDDLTSFGKILNRRFIGCHTNGFAKVYSGKVNICSEIPCKVCAMVP